MIFSIEQLENEIHKLHAQKVAIDLCDWTMPEKIRTLNIYNELEEIYNKRLNILRTQAAKSINVNHFVTVNSSINK